MILGLKTVISAILLLVLAVAINFALSLINAPDDMSVMVGIGILSGVFVACATIGNYSVNKAIKWFKTMAANRAAKKEKSND